MKTYSLGGSQARHNRASTLQARKINVTARLHGELPNDLGELVLFGQASYQGKFFAVASAKEAPNGAAAILGFSNSTRACGPGGTCSATVPAYSTFDLRAELNRGFGSKINLAVAVTNITNKFYYTSSNANLNFGGEGFSYGAPRMAYLEARLEF
jgi:outer membrane receptor protein involved in Fe transport